jgi:hypothetical protein
MKYGKVRKTSSQLLSMTGFSIQEFDTLLLSFKYHWDEYSSCFTLEGNPRQRTSCNRKPSCIPLVNVRIHLLPDILSKTLKSLGELPGKNSRKENRLLGECRNVLLDGAERPIQK